MSPWCQPSVKSKIVALIPVESKTLVSETGRSKWEGALVSSFRGPDVLSISQTPFVKDSNGVYLKTAGRETFECFPCLCDMIQV